MRHSDLHGRVFDGLGAMDLGVMPHESGVAITVVAPGGVGGTRAHLDDAEFDRFVEHLIEVRDARR